MLARPRIWKGGAPVGPAAVNGADGHGVPWRSTFGYAKASIDVGETVVGVVGCLPRCRSSKGGSEEVDGQRAREAVELVQGEANGRAVPRVVSRRKAARRLGR